MALGPDSVSPAMYVVYTWMIHFHDLIKFYINYPQKKVLGPDGYSVHFYKKSWDIVKEDVSKAISSFFSSGKLL